VSTARAPRVAVVGARRVRTGLGAFLAKHLVAHGAEVPAFIASREETIEAGRESLRSVGIEAQGYVDLEALLDAHPVDALVIASPHETHSAWLEEAVTRGLHVLCEKPLVWGDSLALSHALRQLDLASDRRLVVFENCPWPHALAAFDALHPGARAGGVRTVEIEMAPSSTEPRSMLVDVMSHPLSILQAIAGAAGQGVRISAWNEVGEGRVDLSFRFEAETPIAVRIRLRPAPAQPRPMALTVNGSRAERRLEMEDYSMSFADGGREVPIPDPMAALAGDFVRTVRAGGSPADSRERHRRIAARLLMLEQIVGSFPET
jgi:predicted dehydrogenase